MRRRGEIQPGEVQHIGKGQDVEDSPASGSTNQSGVLTYRTLCESIACALNVPIWMVTGSADSENFASSIVSESPLFKLIIHYQKLVTEHYRDTLASAVDISGKFPADWRERVALHCELPQPQARDADKAVDTDLKLLHEGLLSPQHACTRNGLDYEEESDLTKQAEAAGWEAKPDPAVGMPQERPAPRTDQPPRTPHPGE
jgi:hypothetical protein